MEKNKMMFYLFQNGVQSGRHDKIKNEFRKCKIHNIKNKIKDGFIQ